MLRLFATNIVEVTPGRFLTLRHRHKSDRPWRFPGGKIDFGETPKSAAARELLEEVGITATATASEFITCVREEIDGEYWVGYMFAVTAFRGTPRIMEPEKFDSIALLTTAELYALGSTLEGDVVSWRMGIKPVKSILFTPYAVTSIQARILDELRKIPTLSDGQIAARLGTSELLVETSLRTLRRKLGKQLKTRKCSHDRSYLVEWWEVNRFDL